MREQEAASSNNSQQMKPTQRSAFRLTRRTADCCPPADAPNSTLYCVSADGKRAINDARNTALALTASVPLTTPVTTNVTQIVIR